MNEFLYAILGICVAVFIIVGIIPDHGDRVFKV